MIDHTMKSFRAYGTSSPPWMDTIGQVIGLALVGVGYLVFYAAVGLALFGLAVFGLAVLAALIR